MNKLHRNFYERDTLSVAQDLLGKMLYHNSDSGVTVGRIVETEAYIGPDDKASHAYKNRKSKRTPIQYGPGGHAYIYRIYGLHLCFCIVSQKVGMPEVILIRALEPIEGIDIMMKRRKLSNNDIINLTNGPSKLCVAMGIDYSYYAHDLCGDSLFIISDSNEDDLKIISTPRINIDYADEASKYPWRFLIDGNKFVSK